MGHSVSAAQRRIDEALSELPTFQPDLAKTSVPRTSPQAVPRQDLVRRLQSITEPLIVVTAPAGSGKTTVLAQWAAVDDRPFAWLSADAFDNDPVRLVRGLTNALGTVMPFRSEVREALMGTGPARIPVMFPVLGRAVSRAEVPTVLVIDDVHLIEDPMCASVIDTLVRSVPAGSHLVLAGRSLPPISLGRRRVEQDVVELHGTDLSFTTVEASEFLRRSELATDQATVADLVERTDGWAAGVSFAALAMRNGAEIGEFYGGHPLVADYLDEEVLTAFAPEDLGILTRLAVLDRFNGELCDFVLGATGSAERLEAMRRSGNLFIAGFDGTTTWYRLHRLVAELLANRLRSTAPGAQAQVLSRASVWYEAKGLSDRAIASALDAGDYGRAANLVFDATLGMVSSGASWTLDHLLGRFPEDHVASDPRLLLTRAWCRADDGAIDPARTHLRLAQQAAPLPDGDLSIALGATAAIVGLSRPGLTDRLGPHPDLATERSPWALLGDLVAGRDLMLTGECEAARSILNGCSNAPRDLTAIRTAAAAFLALLDEDTGDVDGAVATVRAARAEAIAHGIGDSTLVLSLLAVSSMIEARHGDADVARVDADRTRAILARLADRMTMGQLIALVQVGRALVALDRRSEALEVAKTARRLADDVPQARFIVRQLADLERSTQGGAHPDQTIVSAAELRVLEFLPTHLTLAEIADRLYVSRATVKTHVASIYRKLGVSARSEAVTAASDQHLIDY